MKMRNNTSIIAFALVVAGGMAHVHAQAQTSTGVITVRMPHGEKTIFKGREKAVKPDQLTVDKNSNNPDAVYDVTNSTDISPAVTQQSSGLEYDSNEKTIRYGAHKYKFVSIGSCTFTMGATKEHGDLAQTSEAPSHKVTLFTYWMGNTEVPQWLWQAVMHENPSQNVGDNYPVENVSWNDCNIFTERLSEITGRKVSLPTEAQMELAMRNGKDTNSNIYGTDTPLGDIAWYSANSDNHTHEVAMKSPNDLGLHDIVGNVGEWCCDWFGTYTDKREQAPSGPDSGVKRVYRSAHFGSNEHDCRTSSRFAEDPDHRSPNIGLRLVLK